MSAIEHQKYEKYFHLIDRAYLERNYDKVQSLCQRAIDDIKEEQKRLPHPDHELRYRKCQFIYNLGCVLQAKGEYALSKLQYIKSILLTLKIINFQHLVEGGDSKDKYKLYKMVFQQLNSVEFCELIKGLDFQFKTDILDRISGIADACSYLHQNEESKQHYEVALSIVKFCEGYNYPRLELLLNGYATLLRTEGNFDQVFRLYSEAVQKSLIHTGIKWNKKYSEKLITLELITKEDSQSHLNIEEVQGAKNFFTDILVNFGQFLNSELNSPQKAIQCFQIVLEARAEIFPKNHLSFANTYNILALAYANLPEPNFVEAKKYAKLSTDLFLQADHDPVGQTEAYFNRGSVSLIIKNFQKAEKWFNKSIAVADLVQSKDLLTAISDRINVFELRVKAYFGIENAVLLAQPEDTKKTRGLEASDNRRSRVLIQELSRKTLCLPQHLIHEPLTSMQIQQFAKKQNTTFILYSLSNITKQQLAVWIIPSEGEIQHQILPGEALLQEIEGFEELLTKPPFERKRGSNITIPSLEGLSLRGGESDSPARRAARRRFAREKLTTWYQALIAPIEKHLPKDPSQTVTIVPDGFLAQLPFAAFKDKDGEFLIEKHPISIAPSIKTLQLLDEVRSQRKLSPPEESLIIGNPSVPNMDSLIIGQEEAEDIGKLLHLDKENVLTQERATVSRFLEKLSNARYVFTACHGEADCKPKFDPHSVFEGQLKLTPDGDHSSGDLHSQQISGLNISAELVFLSACYSGTGKVQQEGTIGNVWSFLGAGALSTVATYWLLLETETTKRMVNRFFHHLLGVKGFSKLNKARALQKAMLLGIEENRERFDQWGAFYLSGLSDINHEHIDSPNTKITFPPLLSPQAQKGNSPISVEIPKKTFSISEIMEGIGLEEKIQTEKPPNQDLVFEISTQLHQIDSRISQVHSKKELDRLFEEFRYVEQKCEIIEEGKNFDELLGILKAKFNLKDLELRKKSGSKEE